LHAGNQLCSLHLHHEFLSGPVHHTCPDGKRGSFPKW
jgi:hypothetical protein